jgi:hypothetical protein
MIDLNIVNFFGIHIRICNLHIKLYMYLYVVYILCSDSSYAYLNSYFIILDTCVVFFISIKRAYLRSLQIYSLEQILQMQAV